MKYIYAAPNDSKFLTQRYIMPENDIGELKREQFQHDRDKIIHSRAFRRLMHKTQIFNANEGDHYRNRLTHSLEVCQIARSIGKGLGLNDELIEAIALGHDLGHTPFGHVGERTLHMILRSKVFTNCEIKIQGDEGFKHNFQGLQIVDHIETSSPNYDGMNLSLAVREGILKHTSREIKVNYINKEGNVEDYKDAVNYQSLNLNNINIEKPSFTLEGQVVAIADEIAQCTHDLEDGVRSGIVSIDELLNIDLIKKIIKDRDIDTNNIKATIDARNILIKIMVGYLIEDVYSESKKILEKKYNIDNSPRFTNLEDCYNENVIIFSGNIKNLVDDLLKKIVHLILVSQKISQADSKSEHLIKQLFKAYYMHPLQLPDYILKRYYMKKGVDFNRTKIRDDVANLRKDSIFTRLICDHIACMTDQYVAREYNRLYLPEIVER